MFKNKINAYIIVASLSFALFVSFYNLRNFDKNITEVGGSYHQMIKSDPHRYLSDGYNTKVEWSKGIFFFNSGPENYTKYLPSRIAAIYYYIFDLDLFIEDTNGQKKIKLGIHNLYLYFQTFFYYLCIFFFHELLLIKSTIILYLIQ